MYRKKESKKEGRMGGEGKTEREERSEWASVKQPAFKKEYAMLDAEMCNTGERASEFARKLTKGMDEEFPVK
jgi:hypothetical protein